ncbi:MAG: hypothetical protein LBG19_11855 [Prevotellaceae bacterium]|jgi:hypothetical protein|nr:hypothetical protein [Prevotellaceae bacterium]
MNLKPDGNKLSNAEKRKVTGGYDDDCFVRCRCAMAGEAEKIVRRSQCRINGNPVCFMSANCI